MIEGTTVLVALPRPNPGPIPPPMPWAEYGPLAVSLFVAAWLVIGARWRYKRPRRDGTKPTARATETETRPIVCQSLALREALARRFGEPWAARTTEELGASPELLERLGAGPRDRLLALLSAADRALYGNGECAAVPDEAFEGLLSAVTQGTNVTGAREG